MYYKTQWAHKFPHRSTLFVARLRPITVFAVNYTDKNERLKVMIPISISFHCRRCIVQFCVLRYQAVNITKCRNRNYKKDKSTKTAKN